MSSRGPAAHLAHAKRFALAYAKPRGKPPAYLEPHEIDAWHILMAARNRHLKEEALSGLLEWAWHEHARLHPGEWK